TGRRAVTSGLVLRGTVRALAVLAAAQSRGAPLALRVPDRAAWQTLRRRLDARAETRRAQRRFRRDADRYLAALECQFLQ
ncbi:MAG TPA: ISNCY family transposase, partial [Chloroflexota bacterium]|nr:ISNCY family transposase [Chloroflexota bacterium]